MKKWRTCSLVWCFWIYHKNNIYFFHESIFVHIDCYYLSYFIVRIYRAIFITMFFLITTETFIFYEMSFLFIWSNRNVLCVNDVDIHEIVCKDEQIQKCKSNKLRVSLSIWLLISWNLIEIKIFINLLTQNSKFDKN